MQGKINKTNRFAIVNYYENILESIEKVLLKNNYSKDKFTNIINIKRTIFNYNYKLYIKYFPIMSDSEGGDDEKPQISEAELRKEVEDKCFKAFIDFDEEGNGGQIKSE